jgi:hypothetical protein
LPVGFVTRQITMTSDMGPSLSLVIRRGARSVASVLVELVIRRKTDEPNTCTTNTRIIC